MDYFKEGDISSNPIHWRSKDHMIYTWRHRRAMVYVATLEYDLGWQTTNDILKRLDTHDLDKMYLYTKLKPKQVAQIHRNIQPHHLDNITIPRDYLDYIETIIDWTSNRYTKLDKPETPYEIMIEHFPNAPEELKSIMKIMDIYRPDIDKDQHIMGLCNRMEDPTDQELFLDAVKGYYLFKNQLEKFGNNFVFIEKEE